VITCWPGMTSLDILDEILDQFSEAVGIPGRRRRFKKIQKLLKGTNVLIVFDESQHLLRQHLDTIRTVWDFCKVGIVLMGNETTYDQMHGRQYLSFEQVKSRFTPIRKVNAAMRKDDVREIIHSMGLNVNNDAVDFCYQEAKKWDFFRTVQNIMEQASMMLSGENTEIDVSLLQKAAVYLRS
ncbi:MAG: AAA family ATPase, partial [Candidatus Aminicenantes bacterium]|nr:AAA family ATPase [Candidatus Aminicenantes bacterium]